MLIVAERGREARIASGVREMGPARGGDRHESPMTGDGGADGAGRSSRIFRSTALTDDAPIYDRPAVAPNAFSSAARRRRRSRIRCRPTDALRALLDSPNVGSKRWVYRQYDLDRAEQHDGRARAATPRCCESRGRGAGSRSKSIPIRARARSILISARSRRSARRRAMSPARGRARSESPIASTTAIRNGRRSCGSSSAASRDCATRAIAFGAPVVSGNVSFYNETEGHAIPPTPTIAMVGRAGRRRAACDPVLQARPATRSCWCARRAPSLAASEYAAMFGDRRRGALARSTWRAKRALIEGLVEGARTGADKIGSRCRRGRPGGGVGRSLLQSATAILGAEVELGRAGSGGAEVFFGEGASTVMLSIAPSDDGAASRDCLRGEDWNLRSSDA